MQGGFLAQITHLNKAILVLRGFSTSCWKLVDDSFPKADKPFGKGLAAKNKLYTLDG